MEPCDLSVSKTDLCLPCPVMHVPLMEPCDLSVSKTDLCLPCPVMHVPLMEPCDLSVSKTDLCLPCPVMHAVSCCKQISFCLFHTCSSTHVPAHMFQHTCSSNIFQHTCSSTPVPATYLLLMLMVSRFKMASTTCTTTQTPLSA